MDSFFFFSKRELKMATIVSCKDWTRYLLMILAVIVAGCGGGSGGGNGESSTLPTSILSGVAAVGTPIANGTVNVICATGSALTPTTTSSTGAWQATLSGQTLPCAVEVTGGTINGATNTTSYHSIAVTAGTVNVTPLTDLMVANMVGTATPKIWFAGLNSNPTSLTTITQAQMTTALTKLSTALSGLTPLNTNNPITKTFTPTSGNVSDDMLTALATAMANSGVTYASLLNSASASSFIAPSSGFATALTTAYMGTPSSGAPTPAFALSLSPTSLTFGSQNVGTSSAIQTATLRNTGSGMLLISSISVSGDFSETTTCGATLAAGASCTISVTFTPTTSGGRSGTVIIVSNAVTSPSTLILSGTGTTAGTAGLITLAQLAACPSTNASTSAQFWACFSGTITGVESFQTYPCTLTIGNGQITMSVPADNNNAATVIPDNPSYATAYGQPSANVHSSYADPANYGTVSLGVIGKTFTVIAASVNTRGNTLACDFQLQ